MFMMILSAMASATCLFLTLKLEHAGYDARAAIEGLFALYFAGQCGSAL